MGYYPAMLDLTDRPCLVVGGGEVGLRKVRSLLEAGALVTVIEPEPTPRLEAMAREGLVEVLTGPFETALVDAMWLVIAATDDEGVNRAVSDAAWERGIFVNVVDVPKLSTFIVPASVRRGDLILAVSTSGASPAAAARIRRRLEADYGPAWALYLDLMGRVRAKVLDRGQTVADNRALFIDLAESDLLESIEAGDTAKVEATLVRVCGAGFGLDDLGLDRRWGQK